MKRIFPLVFSAILITMILTSCSEQKNKPAYCFTMVFEKQGERPSVTLYCKVPENTASDKMKNISFTHTAKNYDQAVQKSFEGEYDIYFNSVIAYYFSDDLTPDDKLAVAEILLGNSKYKTNNQVYAEDNVMTEERIHRKAEKVCSDECITTDEKKYYTPVLKYFREQTAKCRGVNNT